MNDGFFEDNVDQYVEDNPQSKGDIESGKWETIRDASHRGWVWGIIWGGRVLHLVYRECMVWGWRDFGANKNFSEDEDDNSEDAGPAVENHYHVKTGFLNAAEYRDDNGGLSWNFSAERDLLWQKKSTWLHEVGKVKS